MDTGRYNLVMPAPQLFLDGGQRVFRPSTWFIAIGVAAMRRLLLLFAALLCSPHLAHAAQPVDVALVLVDDVSGSINDDEFKLQKDGWFSAFTNPRVVAAIHGGPTGAIAVSYAEFASSYQVKTVLDWTVIKDEASARAFAKALQDTPRSFRGHTAIGAGVDLAVQMLDKANYDAQRRVIDVCGDGTNNSGRDVDEARDDAVKQGITINGLAIANESDIPWLQEHTHPPGGLPNYYRAHVVGGEGAFVLEIHDYQSFGEAVTRKLLSEIASARPRARRAS
jgi:hypothetical protein